MNKIISLAIAFAYTFSINATEVPLFPKAEGWNLSEEIKQYDSESLWEYINGAADYYLSYGFEKLKVAEYAQSADIYIKAEIYKHIDNLNAFGIYAYERPQEGNFLDIGTEAYLAHSALNLYSGNYYIKIHSHNSSEETIRTIKKIGKSIVDNLNSTNSIPEEINQLPSDNRIPFSEKYIPSNYMGYSFFSSVIKANYKIEENSFELFCIKHNSPDDAISNLIQYFDFSKLSETPEINQIYEIDDMFNGSIFIAIKNNNIFGLWNAENAILAKEYLTVFLKE